MNTLLSLLLRPAPVAPDLDALRRAWEHLYDTAPDSPEERAAWWAYQKASVELAA